MPPTLTTTLPAAPALGPATRHASWLLPASLLFLLLLLGRWAQVPTAPGGPRAATEQPARSLRSASLHPAVVSAL